MNLKKTQKETIREDLLIQAAIKQQGETIRETWKKINGEKLIDNQIEELDKKYSRLYSRWKQACELLRESANLLFYFGDKAIKDKSLYDIILDLEALDADYKTKINRLDNLRREAEALLYSHRDILLELEEENDNEEK